MPFTIEYLDLLSAIDLQFSSPDSLAEHLQAREQIMALGFEHKCRNIMVDFGGMSDATNMTRQEEYEFTEGWDFDAIRDVRFAIVLPHEKSHQDDWYFIIQLMKQKGVISQTFYSRQDAIDWLSLD